MYKCTVLAYHVRESHEKWHWVLNDQADGLHESPTFNDLRESSLAAQVEEINTLTAGRTRTMPKLKVDPEAHGFDAEDVVWQYRFAHSQGHKATIARLREKWTESRGEDSLHETAFGAPLEHAAIADRVKRNKREILRVILRRETIEAEIAWLEQVMQGDGCGRTLIADPTSTVCPCGIRKAA
jgi:hypothetical protein